jgi:hypothetical protein
MKLTGWLLGGLAVGGLAAWVAVTAAGAGHGSYQPAALLFPYAMAIAGAVGSITPELMAIAAVQYPVYGALIARARKPGSVTLRIIAAHAVLAAVAVWLVTESEAFR